MDADKVKIMGSKVKVDSIMKVAEIEEAEKLKMKRKVEKILKYTLYFLYTVSIAIMKFKDLKSNNKNFYFDL